MRNSQLASILFLFSSPTFLFAQNPRGRAVAIDDVFRMQRVGSPQISPDGAWIAYTVTSIDKDADKRRTALWMVNWDGTQDVRLTFGKESASSANWSPDGKYLSYLASEGEGKKSQIWLLDRRGGGPQQLTNVKGDIDRYRWSPDGKRIAAAFAGPQINGTDIFTVDIARSVPTRLTFGEILTEGTVWSPDATQVAYTSRRAALVKKRFDGSGSEEVISATATAAEVCDWSRDGKWILYMVQGAETHRDLWYVSVTDKGEPRQFLQTKAQETCGQFSPDGKWVAYSSDESGTYQIYVQAFPSGGKWRVSLPSGQNAACATIRCRSPGDGR